LPMLETLLGEQRESEAFQGQLEHPGQPEHLKAVSYPSTMELT